MSSKHARFLRTITGALAIVLATSPNLANAKDKNRELMQADMKGDQEKVARLLDCAAQASSGAGFLKDSTSIHTDGQTHLALRSW